MDIKPIHTEADYQATLKVVSKLRLLKPERFTPKGDRLAILDLLVRAFEAEHYPSIPLDPIAAVKLRMVQRGLKPKDLEPMMGRRNRVYEVLNGQRKLTMNMVRKLHAGLDLPLEILIREMSVRGFNKLPRNTAAMETQDEPG